jgi:hypothetical protein
MRTSRRWEFAGHTELLATRYLKLLVDGNTRQWLNTLPKNSIDSWDEMRLVFVKHFQNNYSRTTDSGASHPVGNPKRNV